MTTRHSKVNKIIKQAGETNDDYYSDQQTLEDVLYHFGNEITKKQAIKALRKCGGDYDEALDYLEIELEKKMVKEAKKESKKKIQTEQPKVEEIPKPQVKRQISRKISRQESDKVDDLSTRAVRKSSINEYQPSMRKLSSQVEDVDVQHYNTEYPKVNDVHALSNSLSVVVIGHVDSGKSTLTGQILQQLNVISKIQIHKNQKESKEIGRQSFKFAWVMDENEDERNKGVTIDVGMRNVGYNGKTIVFLDSPGHKEYIPNMINGAVQADYAILVIDVSKFQSGFKLGGQTKEHAYIVKALGVSTMIIAINKMDLVEWSEQEYMKVKSQTLQYLLEIGFSEDKLVYIPISAFNNLNLVTPKQLSYYQGPPLLQLIGNLDLPPRPVDKPFRLNISNVFQSVSGKLKGNCISGKIEGGVLKQNDKLVILPVNSQVVVKQIMLAGEKVKSATVGDNIECQVKIIDETFFENVKSGNVMSSLHYSIPIARRVIAEILTFELQMPILCGTPVVAYLGCGKYQGKIEKILKIFDSKNRGVTKKENAKAATSNQCCEVELSFTQKVCVELFSNFKRFGRVILRQKHSTLAVGIIKEILPLKKDEK